MPDQSDEPKPGPNILVLRAVFVPDGEQPPPEFDSLFDPLRLRATLDRETGAITCDNAGVNFGGDVRAEWHPDEDQGSQNDEDATDQGGDGHRSGPAGTA